MFPRMSERDPRRIIVIGSGGAGKSTLATRIAARTGLPLIHLDAHYWRPGWVPTPKDEWERTVKALIAEPAWVMDGNYSGTLALRIAAADTIVFLDLPRGVCLRRVVGRRLRYHRQARPDMREGCYERLTWEFIQWIWTYPSRRRPGILERLRAVEGEKRVAILRSVAEADRFVDSL